MAKHGKFGLPNREETKDNLAGAANIKPVYLRGDGISLPRSTPIPATGAGALAEALGTFASESLQASIDARNERMKLDGQMMSAQGDAYDKVALSGGNPQAQEGWRIMTGKTISASLVAAQLAMIENSGYAMTPDEFRNSYTKQLEDSIKGQRPDTATVIRDEFLKQVPILVANHTLARTNYIEKQTYDALVTSIDLTSRDPNGEDAVINFADIGNENSASAYLSDERKMSAIARGIQVAFRNDNPAGYSIIRRAGLLEQLTLEQRNSIEDARTQYTSRMLATADDEYIHTISSIIEQIELGTLAYPKALELITTARTELGIDTDAAVRWDIYKKVKLAGLEAGRIRMNNYMLAVAAGDWGTAGEITADIMERAECAGCDPDALNKGILITSGANKGTRAHSIAQVMPRTWKRPGYGVVPAGNTTPQEIRRVGRDYWKALFKGSALGIGNLPWPPGDVESTAVAYNAGPDNAVKWYNAGKNYRTLPKPSETRVYAKRILKMMEDMRFPTLNEKFEKTNDMLIKVNQDARIKAAQRRHRLMIPVFDEYKNSGDLDQFELNVENVLKKTNSTLTYEIMQEHAARTRQIRSSIEATRGKEEAAVAKVVYAEKTSPAEVAFKAEWVNPLGTDETRMKALTNFREVSVAAMEDMDLYEKATAGFEMIQDIVAVVGAQADRLFKKEINDAMVQAAKKTGNQTRLNKKQSNQLLNEVLLDLEKSLQEKVASALPEEYKQVQAQVAQEGIQAYAELFVKWGGVPAELIDQLTREIDIGLLMDDNKTIRQPALDAILKYAAVREIDKVGHVRDSMLSGAAQATAEEVLYMKGPFGSWKEAMLFVGRDLDPQNEKSLDRLMKLNNVAELIDSAIKTRQGQIDVGLGSVIWGDADWNDMNNYTNGEMKELFGEEGIAIQTEWLNAEMRRLFSLHPRNNVSRLIDMAVNNVQMRTMAIGGSWVKVNFAVLPALFGDKVQNYTQQGILQKAVTEWLASPEVQALHPGMGTTQFVEFLPMSVRELLSPDDGGLPNLFGDFDWTLGDVKGDSKTIIQRQVRTMHAFATPRGDQVYAEIMGAMGEVMYTIGLPWDAIGERYMRTNPPINTKFGPPKLQRKPPVDPEEILEPQAPSNE